MMTTKKSNKTHGLKLLLAVPVAAVAVVAFANPEVESISKEWAAEGNDLVAKAEQHVVLGDKAEVQPVEKVQKCDSPMAGVAASADSLKSNDTEPTCDVPQVQPQFPGGTAAMMAYITKEMRYPEAAVKAKEQGKVIVQFSVDVDGTICEPSIMRSISPALDAEALRIVKNMPKWTPGMENGKAVKCMFVMPFNFSLGGNGTELTNGKTVESFTASTVVTKDGKTINNAHIYVLDGKRITEAELKSINPESIESMAVLNGKSATDKYGEDGKYGVVEIKTKK